MRSSLLAVFLFFYCVGFSQQSFNFTCQKDTVVNGCNTSCITLQAKIPDIYAGATQYGVVTVNTPTGSCFLPPPILPSTQGTGANLTQDDIYSQPLNISFPFTFFGTTYNQLVASTNGLLSFDLTLAGNFSHYSILNSGGFLSALSGTPQDLPSTLYDKALIMGPYHDID